MILSVRTRPVRSAAMAAAKEVISAYEPLIVFSRRKSSKGLTERRSGGEGRKGARTDLQLDLLRIAS